MQRTLSPLEERALQEFKGMLQRAYASRVRSLTVFGSRARGEGNEFSDLDVLVLVDQWDWPMKRKIWDFSTDVYQHHEIDISPLILSQAELTDLKAMERRLVQDIENEGLPL